MLEHHGVAFRLQVLIGPGHDIGLGDFGDAVQPAHFPLPGSAVDERIHELGYAGTVGNQPLHVLQFVIGLGGLYQFLGEISLTQFFHFSQQEVQHLLEGLSFLGHGLCQHQTPV